MKRKALVAGWVKLGGPNVCRWPSEIDMCMQIGINAVRSEDVWPGVVCCGLDWFGVVKAEGAKGHMHLVFCLSRKERSDSIVSLGSPQVWSSPTSEYAQQNKLTGEHQPSTDGEVRANTFILPAAGAGTDL